VVAVFILIKVLLLLLCDCFMIGVWFCWYLRRRRRQEELICI